MPSAQKHVFTLFWFYYTSFKTAFESKDLNMLYMYLFIVTVVQQMSVKSMIQSTVISQLGQDVSFLKQRKSTAT